METTDKTCPQCHEDNGPLIYNASYGSAICEFCLDELYSPSYEDEEKTRPNKNGRNDE